MRKTLTKLPLSSVEVINFEVAREEDIGNKTRSDVMRTKNGQNASAIAPGPVQFICVKEYYVQDRRVILRTGNYTCEGSK